MFYIKALVGIISTSLQTTTSVTLSKYMNVLCLITLTAL